MTVLVTYVLIIIWQCNCSLSILIFHCVIAEIRILAYYKGPAIFSVLATNKALATGLKTFTINLHFNIILYIKIFLGSSPLTFYIINISSLNF